MESCEKLSIFIVETRLWLIHISMRQFLFVLRESQLPIFKIEKGVISIQKAITQKNLIIVVSWLNIEITKRIITIPNTTLSISLISNFKFSRINIDMYRWQFSEIFHSASQQSKHWSKRFLIKTTLIDSSNVELIEHELCKLKRNRNTRISRIE